MMCPHTFNVGPPEPQASATDAPPAEAHAPPADCKPAILFAGNITTNGFNNSQLEIDDKWETCYGDFTFDRVKFPDPKGMNDILHNMVTI